MSMWTSLQGREEVGTPIALADADLAALDRRNTTSNQID
jgi:hypothetical protein